MIKSQEKLNSASNWGIFDMFGGGLFSAIMKHSKMDDAQQLMEAAKTDLWQSSEYVVLPCILKNQKRLNGN